MGSLYKVLKAYKYKLDEKRQDLLRLQKMMIELENESKVLENRLLEEAAHALSTPETSLFYDDYRHYVLKRREEIGQMLENLDKQMDDKKEEVIEQFQEVKKVELTVERQMDEKKLHENKLEQEQNDESGLVAFRRLN